MKYIAVVIALAGCAASPESIEPVAVSSSAYSGASCRVVASERSRADAALSDLYVKQRETAELDAGGVLMLGLPVGSMYGGDVEPEIAALKGQIEAMDARLAGC